MRYAFVIIFVLVMNVTQVKNSFASNVKSIVIGLNSTVDYSASSFNAQDIEKVWIRPAYNHVHDAFALCDKLAVKIFDLQKDLILDRCFIGKDRDDNKEFLLTVINIARDKDFQVALNRKPDDHNFNSDDVAIIVPTVEAGNALKQDLINQGHVVSFFSTEKLEKVKKDTRTHAWYP